MLSGWRCRLAPSGNARSALQAPENWGAGGRLAFHPVRCISSPCARQWPPMRAPLSCRYLTTGSRRSRIASSRGSSDQRSRTSRSALPSSTSTFTCGAARRRHNAHLKLKEDNSELASEHQRQASQTHVYFGFSLSLPELSLSLRFLTFHSHAENDTNRQ